MIELARELMLQRWMKQGN